MSDIFLSYASRDRETAKAVASALEKQGWSVWWDRRIPTGRDYAEVIESQLAESRCVVVLWSKASAESEWVKTEAADAKDRRLLVPVLIEAVKIPLEFRRVQAADLIGWRAEAETHPGFETLVTDLAALLGRPALPPLPTTEPKPTYKQRATPLPPPPVVADEGARVEEEHASTARRPLRERPLLLLGGLTLVIAALSSVIWFKLIGGGRVESVGQASTPTVTPTFSPTPVNNNTRPSPTPTPNTNSNRAGNNNGAGGDNRNGGLNSSLLKLMVMRRQFDALDSHEVFTRKEALSVLITDHASDPSAVGEALNRLDAKLKESTEPDRMTHLFLYLNQTEYSAWTPELLARARAQFRHIDRVEMDGEGLTQYDIYKRHVNSFK